MPAGFPLALRYAWHTLRARPSDPAHTVPLPALHHAHQPNGMWSPGFHVRRGWLPSDPFTTARVLSRFTTLPHPVGTEKLIAPTASALLAAGPDIAHPRALAAMLHAFLNLHTLDPAGGRFLPAIQGCAQKLILTQDLAGTWTTKADAAPACTAAVQAGWALLRGQTLGVLDDPRLLRIVTQSAEWALGKQKTNGYFYACTWSTDPATNPLLVELLETVEGLLQLGLLLDEKRYRSAALLTLRHLAGRIPARGLMPAAWTSEWNPEHHQGPLGHLRLRHLIAQAQACHAPELGQIAWSAAMDQLRRNEAGLGLPAGGLGVPELAGWVPGAFPAWGREAPWTISTEATLLAL